MQKTEISVEILLKSQTYQSHSMTSLFNLFKIEISLSWTKHYFWTFINFFSWIIHVLVEISTIWLYVYALIPITIIFGLHCLGWPFWDIKICLEASFRTFYDLCTTASILQASASILHLACSCEPCIPAHIPHIALCYCTNTCIALWNTHELQHLFVLQCISLQHLAQFAQWAATVCVVFSHVCVLLAYNLVYTLCIWKVNCYKPNNHQKLEGRLTTVRECELFL